MQYSHISAITILTEFIDKGDKGLVRYQYERKIGCKTMKNTTWSSSPGSTLNFQNFAVFKVLDKFDYYKCVRDRADVDITCTGDFKIRREKALDSDDNVVSIIFDNTLQQGQEVEFSLSYFCSEVIDRDIEFHYTWIMHPTDLLIMEITPPEPENNRQAKYHVHLNKGCPWGIEKIIESADVFLDATSSSYKLEIPQPNLYTTCGVYWGRMYW